MQLVSRLPKRREARPTRWQAPCELATMKGGVEGDEDLGRSDLVTSIDRVIVRLDWRYRRLNVAWEGRNVTSSLTSIHSALHTQTPMHQNNASRRMIMAVSLRVIPNPSLASSVALQRVRQAIARFPALRSRQHPRPSFLRCRRCTYARTVRSGSARQLAEDGWRDGGVG